MFRKLRTVIYHVNDLDRAKEWYAKATGIQPYFDQPFYVGFDINGYELGLDPDISRMVPGNQTISYWDVENLESAVKKISGLGAKIVLDKTNVGGPIFIAIIEDPFGNQLGLIEGA